MMPSPVANVTTLSTGVETELRMSEVTMSQVTMNQAPVGPDFEAPPHSARTKVSTGDVINIFRPSITQATVTSDQVQRVKKLHETISSGMKFSFDYACLLVIASILAGIGLAAGSGTIVVASMLVSPLMGPVVGMAYGATIWDWKLVRRSMKNEVISILICIVIGLLVGVCTHWTDMAEDWPTEQMSQRGEWQNFLVGIPVAFFSGLGVGLSVLDQNVSSLVGVAVSASLLPPAVNSGLLMVYNWFLMGGGQKGNSLGYSRKDYSQFATVSLLLTLINVVLVMISSMLMFRIKEVLPIEKKEFWNDLKTARRIYQHRAFGERGSHVDAEEGENRPPETMAV